MGLFCRQLVSSYRSQFGCVEYYVNVVMERPDLPAVECRKYFEVMEPVDINTSDLTVRQSQQYH